MSLEEGEGRGTTQVKNAGSLFWLFVYIGKDFQHYMMEYSLILSTWYQFTIAMLKQGLGQH
jgi:hypothetical protein